MQENFNLKIGPFYRGSRCTLEHGGGGGQRHENFAQNNSKTDLETNRDLSLFHQKKQYITPVLNSPTRAFEVQLLRFPSFAYMITFKAFSIYTAWSLPSHMHNTVSSNW